jgi:hypothetical protein
MATHLVVGGNRHGQRQTVPHGRRVTMPKLKPASILRASAPHQAQPNSKRTTYARSIVAGRRTRSQKAGRRAS